MKQTVLGKRGKRAIINDQGVSYPVEVYTYGNFTMNATLKQGYVEGEKHCKIHKVLKEGEYWTMMRSIEVGEGILTYACSKCLDGTPKEYSALVRRIQRRARTTEKFRKKFRERFRA